MLGGEAEKLRGSRSLFPTTIKFGEPPGDYFTRTIHAGNVGVVGIDAVAYYHDMALTLPRLTDSVEESAWG